MSNHRRRDQHTKGLVNVKTVDWIYAIDMKAPTYKDLEKGHNSPKAIQCWNYSIKLLNRAVSNARRELERIESFLKLRQEAQSADIQVQEASTEDDKVAIQEWLKLDEDAVKEALDAVAEARAKLDTFVEDSDRLQKVNVSEVENEVGVEDENAPTETDSKDDSPTKDKVVGIAYFVVSHRTSCQSDLAGYYGCLKECVTATPGLKAARGKYAPSIGSLLSRSVDKKKRKSGSVADSGPSGTTGGAESNKQKNKRNKKSS